MIRFKIAGAVYSPVEVFLRTLKEHGHKIHIHREILLIATRLWSIPEFCELMVEDNWLQVFSKIVSLTEDQVSARTWSYMAPKKHGAIEIQ